MYKKYFSRRIQKKYFCVTLACHLAESFIPDGRPDNLINSCHFAQKHFFVYVYKRMLLGSEAGEAGHGPGGQPAHLGAGTAGHRATAWPGRTSHGTCSASGRSCRLCRHLRQLCRARDAPRGSRVWVPAGRSPLYPQSSQPTGN